MSRPFGVARDEGQIDLDRIAEREVAFGLLRGVLEPLERHRVAAQVETGVLLKPIDQVLDDAAVEILAAEEGIARGCEHFDHAVRHLEDRDVEGAAAQVVDGDLLITHPTHAVGEGRRGRLVDDPKDFESCNLARVLGALALCIIEVGGHRDHRLLHRLREVLLGDTLHLAQHDACDLGAGEALAADLDARVFVRPADDLEGAEIDRLLHFRIVESATDQALAGGDRVARVRDRLTLGQMSDEALPVLGDAEHRGRRLVPPRVRDHRGLTVLDHRHT